MASTQRRTSKILRHADEFCGADGLNYDRDI